MKYFVSCGEISGDLHLSYIVKEIKKQNKAASFFGVGGKHSEKAGVTIIQNIDELAIMGFAEALKKYKVLKAKAESYINYIIENDIKNVILVDYGGFNLRFLEKLKLKVKDVKIFYYIPPKVWVWGEKRIKKLIKADHIIVIFPWEKDFYKKRNIEVAYFGNPFMEKYNSIEAKGENILLLPGSRKQEVKKLLPIMLENVRKMKDKNFILKLAKKEHLDWIEEDIKNYSNLKVEIEAKLDDVVKESSLAIAASGTVTLELALMGLPSVVIYKASIINEVIARLFLNIKYVSLVNIALNKEVYKELLQKECNSNNIEVEINIILENKGKMKKELLDLRKSLDGEDILKKYAEFILGRSKNV